MSDFAPVTGFYRLLFMYIEPFSTILPALMIWGFPGATWFHHQLIPDTTPVPRAGLLDQRSVMAVWQLGNCYLLLGLLEGLVFRAVRDTLPDNPAAQERLLGASLIAMAIADLTHILASWFALPSALQYNPGSWNATTHGNISFVIFLLAVRLGWFKGIGRQTYYYGQKAQPSKTERKD